MQYFYAHLHKYQVDLRSLPTATLVPSNTSWLGRSRARWLDPCSLPVTATIHDGTLRFTYNKSRIIFFPPSSRDMNMIVENGLDLVHRSSGELKGIRNRVGSSQFWYGQYICDLYLYNFWDPGEWKVWKGNGCHGNFCDITLDEGRVGWDIAYRRLFSQPLGVVW